jgi:hypothetical protein
MSKIPFLDPAWLKAGLVDTSGDAGSSGQILSSTGSGVNWINQGDITSGQVDKALSLTLQVKNTESVALTKGQVVCAAPTATPPSGNVIEVKLADNDGTDSMPAIGILNEGLDAAGGENDEGEAIMFGRISGIDTSAFSVGDEVFVSDTAGALIATKPTGVKYIQKVGVVMRDDASNGTIEVFGAGRTNDVPTPLYIDHTNQRLGIGTASPGAKLEVAGTGELSFKINNTQHSRSLIIEQGGGYSHLKASHVSGIAINYGQGNPGILSLFNNTTQAVKINTNGNSYLNGGNVGIGTTSPSHDLTINSATGGQLQFQYNTLSRLRIEADSGGGSYYAAAGFYHRFFTSGAERMRIDSSGNVGIGTTSPSQKIEVSGSVNNNDIAVLIKNNYDDNLSTSRPAAALLFSTASNNGYLRVYGAPADTAANHQIDLGSTAGGSYLTFSPSGSEKMRIEADGSIIFNDYGSGSNTGTVAYNLAVDSSGNIIENSANTRSVFVATSTASGYNINTTTTISWNSEDIKDSGYTHSNSTNNDSITITQAGTYKIYAAITYTTAVVRANVALQILVNGTATGARGAGGYVRSQSGHSDGTTIVEDYVTLSANDVIKIQTSQEAAAGTVNLISGESKIIIEKLTGLTLSTTNANTLGGLGATDFVQVSGDTMTGDLYLDDGDGATPSLYFKNGANNFWRYLMLSGGDFSIKEGTSTRLTFQAGGNVGIGTTSPSRKLDVRGDAQILSTGATGLRIVGGNTDEVYMIFGDAADNSMGGFGYDNNTNELSIDVNNSEAIRIDSSGNVGIGATNPENILHLKSPNPYLILEDTSNANKNRIANVDGNMHYHADYNNQMGNSRHIFYIDNSEKLRINTNGNVGIGTSSPGQKLDVSGNIKMTETAATTDTDKFVVLDSGVLKYRTGAQVLSDIGAAASSHNHDDRYYTETESDDRFLRQDGSGKEFVFEVNDEGNLSGNKWYKIASVNQGNGGLHIRGFIANHVESFTSQKINLAINGRESNDGSNIEVIGTVDVLHNNETGTDKAGIRIIKATDSTYDRYDVYVRTSRYNMLRLHLTKSGNTSFYTSPTPATTEPQPVSGGNVEIDTSSFLPGIHTVTDSVVRQVIKEDGNVGIGTTSPAAKLEVAGNSILDKKSILRLPGMSMGSGGITDEYLVIARKYDGVNQNATGIIGKIIFSRGGTTAGNNPSEYYINIQCAYNGDALNSLTYTGSEIFTSLDVVDISGTDYYALKVRSNGGGDTSDRFYAEGLLMDDGDSNIFTRVRSSDASVTVVSTGSMTPTVKINGSGTANYVTKWSDTDTITNSTIYDNGTNVGIGTSSPSETFTLQTQGDGLGNEGIFIKNPFAGTSPVVNSKSPFLSLGTSTASAYNSTIYMGRNATATDQESKIEWSNANNGLSIYVKGMGTYREHVRFGNLSSGTPRTYFGGNVGIGTTNPDKKLDIKLTDTSSGTYYAQTVGGSNHLTGYAVGIGFDPEGYGNRNKVGIVVEGTGSGWSTGHMHFVSVSTAGTSSEATIADAKMTITSNGNVGIGTTNPATKLHIGTLSTSGVTTEEFRIQSGTSSGNGGTAIANLVTGSFGTSGIYFGNQSTYTSQDAYLKYADSSNATTLNFNATLNLESGSSGSRMYINSVGNVGIGTTSPGEKLTISGGNLLVAGDYQSLYVGGKTDSSQDGIRMSIDNAGNGYFDHRGSGLLHFRVDSSTGATSRMVINSSGNVGIGTTNPTAKLGIHQAANNGNTGAFTNTHLKLSASATADGSGFCGITAATSTANNYGYSFGAQRTSGGVGDFKINYHNNSASGTNRFLIDQNGNVGIGTTSPGKKLHISSTDQSTARIRLSNTNTGSGGDNIDLVAGVHNVTQDGFSVYNATSNQTQLVIQGGGNVGIGTSTPSYKLDVAGTIRATGDVIAYSDVRVKENIKTIDNSLEKVNQLRGVEFNKIGEDKKSIGVIAQEIEKILPEVVRQDDKGMKSVAYGNITAVLIEAIKEQQKQIDELKNKLNAFTK